GLPSRPGARRNGSTNSFRPCSKPRHGTAGNRASAVCRIGIRRSIMPESATDLLFTLAARFVMETIVLTDAHSGSTARIAPVLGFNCFEFIADVEGQAVDVI